MKKPEQYVLAMFFSLRPCSWSPAQHELNCRVVAIDTERTSDDCQRGHMESVSWFEYDSKQRDLEGLKFVAHVNENGTCRSGDPVFDSSSSATFMEVRRMARTVARIEKSLEKLQAARGYAVDVADEFGRLAETIGCTLFLEPKSDRGYDVTGYRNSTYDSIGSAVDRIRYLLAENKQRIDNALETASV